MWPFFFSILSTAQQLRTSAVSDCIPITQTHTHTHRCKRQQLYIKFHLWTKREFIHTVAKFAIRSCHWLTHRTKHETYCFDVDRNPRCVIVEESEESGLWRPRSENGITRQPITIVCLQRRLSFSHQKKSTHQIYIYIATFETRLRLDREHSESVQRIRHHFADKNKQTNLKMERKKCKKKQSTSWINLWLWLDLLHWN